MLQGSYSDLYPDSDDSSEDQIENSKNTWSCKVRTQSPASRVPRSTRFDTLFNPPLQFVSSGGLQLLLDIFNSGILEPKDKESWTVVSPSRVSEQATA